MASKPYNNPILSFKGYDNLYDLLNIFPFDICYKHLCLVSDETIPNIPAIIKQIRYLSKNHQFRDAHISGNYNFVSFIGFRLITSNKQYELTFEFNKK